MAGRGCWPGSRSMAWPEAVAVGVGRRIALAAAAGLMLGGRAVAQEADGVTLGDIQIPLEGSSVRGTFGRPAGAGPFPIVLVAENGTGLDRVVTDACRGLAKEGFLAVAPALFAGDPPDGAVMMRLDAALAWAGQNGGDTTRAGIVGFGPGGRAAWLYDAFSPAMKAAAAWYGPLGGTTTPARPTTALEAAASLHGPLLGLYGKNDGTPQRVLLEAEAKAKKAGKVAEIVLYVGAGQNFPVAGSPAFDQAATIDGWIRTIAWMREHGVK